MTSDMVLASPSQARPGLELTPDERTELAHQLHREIVDVSDALARAWFEIAELLWPIFSLELWRELTYDADGVETRFASFNEYAEIVVRQPVTTLRNSIYTYHQVRELGFDPAALRDIRQSRVQDLARVLKAFEGAPPADVWEPLVDAARTATSRPEVADYRRLISDALEMRGVESEEFLRLKGEATQVQMVRDCIALAQEDLAALGFPGVPDLKALEYICANWAASRPGRNAS
jgi:hypothetical protein